MSKILYINTSYDFSKGVNANRVYSLLNYLTSKKINILHLTPKKAIKVRGVEELVVPFSFSKNDSMYVNYIREKFFFRDSRQNQRWVDDIKSYVDKNPGKFKDIRLVLINQSPWSIIKLGTYFKKKFGCTIIADLHDPFAYSMYRMNPRILDSQFRRYERSLFKDVDILLMMTPSMATVYKKHYPDKRVIYIPAILPEIPKVDRKIKNKKVINMVYGGSLFGGRTIFPLLNALKEFPTDFYTITIVGNSTFYTRSRYLKYHNLVWKSRLSRGDYFSFLKDKTDIGLVVQSFKIRSGGISAIAAKTYEYLAANKPVIYIGPKGDNTEMIKKYSLNYCLVTGQPDDIIKLKNFLKNFKDSGKNTRTSFYRDFEVDKVFKPVQEIINSFLK